ncbi:serine hydrolase [Candidatus Parcubacteria bacterium]|nr:serine hydrolase [Candidatus Parcubacteria bacterium]
MRKVTGAIVAIIALTILYSVFLHATKYPLKAELSTSSTFSAPVYLVKDLKTGEMYLNKDDTKRVPIASITKLMTAVIALENVNLDDITVVYPDDLVSTSKTRFKIGDDVRYRNLLYPLLMESSNEAANIFTHSVGWTNFLKLMYLKALSLGMNSTRYADPSGISQDNISTAEDLYTLAKYIYEKHPEIFKITAGKGGQGTWLDLHDFNNFIDNPYFVGGKNGQTTAARQTILTVLGLPSVDGIHPVVFIALGSEDRIHDEKQLIDYVLSHSFPLVAQASLTDQTSLTR